MRFLVIISFILSSVFTFAQIQIEKTSHDFGNLYDNAPTHIDFVFKNIGQSKTYLLTVDKPNEVYYIYSSKTIQADSSVTVRLKVNDKIKGRFNYRVDVYFSNSNTPTTLTLTGNVKERSSSPLTACPDFNALPPENGLAQFDVTIKVIDSLTGEPIRRSKVYLINNGTMVGVHYTNSNGFIRKPVPLGMYYITAEKTGYISNYHEGYLNFQENYVEIPIRRPEVEIETIAPEIVELEDEPEEIIIEEETPEIVIEIEEEPAEIVIEETEEPEVIVIETEEPEAVEELVEEVPEDTAKFSDTRFAPNNIVFIVDVSSSMNQMGKMDLLKYSMIELTKILREQDKVTLIAYSGTVRVLLEFESGDNKEEIIAKVQSLKSGGYTDGSTAIKQGIKLAKKGYIEGGNNLIFMVTDGAFNKGGKNYMRLIESTHKDMQIKFSVVGIKTSEYLTNNLSTIASKGGGSYVRIITIDDAQTKMLEEVKRTSERIH